VNGFSFLKGPITAVLIYQERNYSFLTRAFKFERKEEKREKETTQMKSMPAGSNQSSNMKVSEETISFNGYEKALLLSLEDKFNCVVCEHRYQNPVHLTCGHICCRSVVDFLFQSTV
jgi:hypothetical protein